MEQVYRSGQVRPGVKTRAPAPPWPPTTATGGNTSTVSERGEWCHTTSTYLGLQLSVPLQAAAAVVQELREGPRQGHPIHAAVS